MWTVKIDNITYGHKKLEESFDNIVDKWAYYSIGYFWDGEYQFNGEIRNLRFYYEAFDWQYKKYDGNY